MKNQIVLNETELHNFIEENVKDVLSKLKYKIRINENMNTKRKYINRIYRDKNVDQYLHSCFRDDNWYYLHSLIDAIQEVKGIIDVSVSVENGGYKERDGSKWKEYNLEITADNGEIIRGTITCSFCGSMKDVTDRYDMTLVMY